MESNLRFSRRAKQFYPSTSLLISWLLIQSLSGLVASKRRAAVSRENRETREKLAKNKTTKKKFTAVSPHPSFVLSLPSRPSLRSNRLSSLPLTVSSRNDAYNPWIRLTCSPPTPLFDNMPQGKTTRLQTRAKPCPLNHPLTHHPQRVCAYHTQGQSKAETVYIQMKCGMCLCQDFCYVYHLLRCMFVLHLKLSKALTVIALQG